MINVNNVTFRFGKREIFHDFNYQINESGLYIFQQESGFGKTTFIRLILKELKPKSGSITSTFKKIAYLPQKACYVKDHSVVENIGYTGFSSKSLLQYFDMEDYSEEELDRLSLGQKQIILFIRTIVQDYDLLILDEPFQNMDRENVDKALKLIKKISETKAVLLVTHETINTDLECENFEREEYKTNLDILSRSKKTNRIYLLLSFIIAFIIGISGVFGFSYSPPDISMPYRINELYNVNIERDYANPKLTKDNVDYLYEVISNVDVTLFGSVQFETFDLDEFTGGYWSEGPVDVFIHSTKSLKQKYDYDFSNVRQFYVSKSFAWKICQLYRIQSFEDFEKLYILSNAVHYYFGGYVDDSEYDSIFISDDYYRWFDFTNLRFYTAAPYNFGYEFMGEHLDLEKDESIFYITHTAVSPIPNEYILGEKYTLYNIEMIFGGYVTIDLDQFKDNNNSFSLLITSDKYNKALSYQFQNTTLEPRMKSMMMFRANSDTAEKYNLINVSDIQLERFDFSLYQPYGSSNEGTRCNYYIFVPLITVILVSLLVLDTVIVNDHKSIKTLEECDVSCKKAVLRNLKPAIFASIIILLGSLVVSFLAAFFYALDAQVLVNILRSLMLGAGIVILHCLIYITNFVVNFFRKRRE